MKMQRRPFTSMKYCKKRDIDFLFNTAYDFEKIIVRRPSLLNHSFFIPCNKNTLHTEKDNEDLVKKEAQNWLKNGALWAKIPMFNWIERLYSYQFLGQFRLEL